MYDDILVPTDGSDAALAALDHALSIADRFDATVHALYVVETDPIGHSAPALDRDSVREALQDEGERAVAAVEERSAERGVASTGDVIEGVPETAILDYVDEGGIDLIAMGTHGRDGLDRYLVGSVTERVIRRTHVPVVVVREEVT
ncbi:universal stress protein [Haloplanus salilacus]|uniref:universal stress protein n=1 Tax=Haloplanus salilacus TaxID=2949994 RepID=UPI0030D30109